MFDYESKRYKLHINEIKVNKIHGQTNENEKSRKCVGVIFLKNTRSNSGKEEYKSLNNTTFERKLC